MRNSVRLRFQQNRVRCHLYTPFIRKATRPFDELTSTRATIVCITTIILYNVTLIARATTVNDADLVDRNVLPRMAATIPGLAATRAARPWSLASRTAVTRFIIGKWIVSKHIQCPPPQNTYTYDSSNTKLHSPFEERAPVASHR